MVDEGQITRSQYLRILEDLSGHRYRSVHVPPAPVAMAFDHPASSEQDHIEPSLEAEQWELKQDALADIAAGTFSLERATRDYVRAELGFRMIRAADGREALQVERLIQRGALAAGRPRLNPLH